MINGKVRVFFGAVLLAWLVQPAAGQTANAAELPKTLPLSLRDQIDALFADWDRWDSPGAALAVARKGRILHVRGYGSANLEYSQPNVPSTIFHVASVSKQFTCFALLLLEQEGKLSLDDDVRRYVPEVPDFGATITLRHLAHHTSGLRDQWELLAMAGWRLDDVITTEQILRMISRQEELNFEPGSEYLYSNTGFTLLAEVVARVSGESFAEFTDRHIFKPLGMSRTHFHDDHEKVVPGRAYSYAPDGPDPNAFRKSVLSYATVGATSLFTTVEDLVRWLDNLDTGAVGGKEVVEAMHRRGRLDDGEEIDYAMGLVHGTYRSLPVVSHSGGDAGFRTFVLRVPEERLSIALLSNLSTFRPNRLAMEILDLLLGERLGPAQTSTEEGFERLQIAPEVLDRYVGSFRLSIGPVVKIFRRYGALIAEVPGSPPAELVPVGENEFYIEELGAHVAWQPGEPGGLADRFTVELEGQVIEGERVGPPPAGVLDGLAGTYYSPELATTYTLVRQGEGLVAQHQRHPDISLVPISQDELAGNQWFFGRLLFERDASDGVRGFRLSGGRVRDLRFERVGVRVTGSSP